MKNSLNAVLLSVAIFVGIVGGTACALAKTAAPKGMSYDSLPLVKKGGTFIDVLKANPITFNPLLIHTVPDREVEAYLDLSLFNHDGMTYEYYPALAEKVDISKDHKDYTYTLNKIAKWSDGTSVTTDDFIYTFDKMMDPKTEAAAQRSYYTGVSIQKMDVLKFKFHVEKPQFNSIDALNEFIPVQKAQFEKEADFNKARANLHPVVTGPYQVKAFSKDQFLTLERVPNWWAKDLPQFKARFNFDVVQLKIMSDPALAYETFLKGDMDAYNFNTDQYVLQARGSDKDKVGKTQNSGQKVWAMQFPSDAAQSWFGVALNQKHAFLKSLKVRQALTYLIDYDTLNQKVFYGLNDQCVTPFGGRTDNTPPELKNPKNLYHYDPKKAAELLKQDGWAGNGTDNFLHKSIDGKDTVLRFQLKFNLGSAPASGTVQMMKEEYKKAGIDLDLRSMDTTALFQDFEDSKFDAILMGWGGGGIYPDPRQLWHSASAAGGSNKESYRNPEVDQLIEKADFEFNMKKREKIMQKITTILYHDLPYIFLSERKFILEGLNSRVKSPRWVERYSTSVANDLFYF
jgi:ABC-type transport system substrate-binding protein